MFSAVLPTAIVMCLAKKGAAKPVTRYFWNKHVLYDSAAKGKKRSYAYYRCIGTDAYRFGGQRICDNKQVRTDLLEESVWQDVCLLLSNPQRVEQEYKRCLTDRKKSVGWNGVEQLHALIKKVKRGIVRLVDAYQDGLIDKAEFEPRIRKAKESLAKLRTEAKVQADKEAQQKELRLVIGYLKEFAHKVNNNLEQADWMTRREIMRALVKRIEVDKEAVRVVYRVAPPPFAQAPKKGLLHYCLRCEYSPGRSPGGKRAVVKKTEALKGRDNTAQGGSPGKQ